ncbi:MAG: phosphoribosylformylglycinamidine synthase, partial [Clostridiales bacterium]|nr:phosphoribosylformylglycinamidine synthase [Clostridiales bacterium]
MNNKVRRIYVEKREGYDVEARGMFGDLRNNLGIGGLEALRIIHRYDVAGISEEEFEKSKNTIFSEPPVDNVYEGMPPMEDSERYFAVEYLPGQYDQRADSAAQCIQMLTLSDRPQCRAARIIALKGRISEEDYRKIKDYCINPVESHEAELEMPESLEVEVVQPENVKVLTGFTLLQEEGINSLWSDMGLAMSAADLAFCRDYFKNTEKRDPTITEIRLIDTYWSDHCRHTTFLTAIEEVDFEDGKYTGVIKQAFEEYIKSREFVHGEKLGVKDISLMDLATIGAKELNKKGMVPDLDISDEINACSIVVDARVNGKNEEWLVMFKNETHNHPTEIEPFGGAATCLGGAIRDPLSGRSYVYQAMRVTGSGDPRTKVADTIPGKLPQRKITAGAAAGYSSYGNQIGLSTGQVTEIYDEGYVAKRMEIGAVIGAVPKKDVVREKPETGDVIILLGGRTGRDGCGGATGSSKEHTEESLLTCGAEVQKGNPPTE